MQTNFSTQQLADPDLAASERILRVCVHCGLCTATCPTFLLLGDELDSPRGRIYLIKNMLETGMAADAQTVKHVDRCLSCLSCMTTCPSGVHYMHLVDHARERIEQTYVRPLPERLLRALLAIVLPRPTLFRLALYGARLGAPFAKLMPGRLKGLMAMAPRQIPKRSPMDMPQVHKARGKRHARVALLTGCAQRTLDPAINEATIRLLNRHGCDVVVASGAGCCGALTHHMGRSKAARLSARRNIAAWCGEMDGEGLDHIVINTSGCGTTIKDYGYMFRDDPAWAEKAARVSAMALDITELMARLGVTPTTDVHKLKIAYHSACSMLHGQKIAFAPVSLLEQAGFTVLPIPEGHICCGSAGTYNLLQPEIAADLRDRKVRNINATGAEAVAAGNIGCMIQIASGTDLPVVHTAQLLDWATGGPAPEALEPIVAARSRHQPSDFITEPAA